MTFLSLNKVNQLQTGGIHVETNWKQPVVIHRPEVKRKDDCRTTTDFCAQNMKRSTSFLAPPILVGHNDRRFLLVTMTDSFKNFSHQVNFSLVRERKYSVNGITAVSCTLASQKLSRSTSRWAPTRLTHCMDMMLPNNVKLFRHSRRVRDTSAQ